MAERASGSDGPELGRDRPSGPWVPERIKQALSDAADFASFRRRRIFRFIHLFSGKNDVLGSALKEEAKNCGLNVEVRALDLSRDTGDDLLKDEPYLSILEEAKQGLWDGGHAGPPCGSFSAARWNRAAPGPPPVRSRTEIYGLSTNSANLQRQADEGTILATRSSSIVGAILKDQARRMVPLAGTLENPPGTDGGPDGPMWLLPEIKVFEAEFGSSVALFNTCAYQKDSRVKWFKPGKFVGKLEGLPTLSRRCSCPAGFRHHALVGKSLTERAAEYPGELCTAYAKLVMKAWKQALEREWWRHMLVTKESEVSELQVKWLESKQKKQRLSGEVVQPVLKRSWSWVGDADHAGPDVKRSKRSIRDEENDLALGGMRNPWAAVKRLSKVAEVGRDIARLWRHFVQRWPEALDTARDYGSKACSVLPECVEAWRKELMQLLRGKPSQVVLKEKIEFSSPLQANLWEAWQQASSDPEKYIAIWAREGAPLGMSSTIPPSGGVFPAVAEFADEAHDAPALEWRVQLKNYSSVQSDPAGAAQELGRYLDQGFAKRLSKEEARHRFGSGTMSKLALITKEKSDGSLKRRIIIDLLRSGGNSRARVPERIVLPRCTDVVESMRRLWRIREERLREHDPLDDIREEDSDDSEDGIELVGADLSDAYCHFGVANEELKNCLAPALEEDEILVFCAMLFGFKGAPLIMGRLSAALARLWQSMIMRDGELQLYMDDPLFGIVGPRSRRRGVLAMLLYTAAAMGVNLAYHKGERGLRLCWIGVQLEWCAARLCFCSPCLTRSSRSSWRSWPRGRGRAWLPFGT